MCWTCSPPSGRGRGLRGSSARRPAGALLGRLLCLGLTGGVGVLDGGVRWDVGGVGAVVVAGAVSLPGGLLGDLLVVCQCGGRQRQQQAQAKKHTEHLGGWAVA